MKTILTFAITMMMTASAFAAHVEPVYRFWNGHFHLYSTRPNEGTHKGYAFEGQVFNVARRPFQGAVPLYRCLVPAAGAEFLSVNPGCEGQAPVERLGFVFSGNAPGTVGLTRCVQTSTGDHLSTTDANECYAAGYQVEGGLGFVYR